MDMQVIKRGAAFLTIIVVASGCAGASVVNEYPYSQQGDTSPTYVEGLDDYESKRSTVFGEGGLSIGGNDRPELGGGGGLGVNSYLWRASLDTIAFMPVNSADPFGGVIITDWHSPGQVNSERFKMNVYILGRALRADGVRVAVFRQVQDRAGLWRDAGIPQQTATTIEDAILTRARQLRNQTLSQ